MAHGANETEIKLAVESTQAARRLLRAAGFTVSRRRVFESNVIFDTPKLTLRKAATLLRVRKAGGLSTITYKGRPAVAKHKSREELELEIADAGTMSAIIERLGLSPVFRYEKQRTEYRQSRGAGMAMLDETPVGVYLELEGEPRWIDRTARQLGFSEQDYIVHSYARLYLEWCRRKQVKAGDMVFGRAGKKARGQEAVKKSGGRRKRLSHKNAGPCAPKWDRRFRLSTPRSERVSHNF